MYGGLQDNGTWTAPARSPGGIENSDWENLGGGDGFCRVPDPRDPDIVYWEWQGGNLNRLQPAHRREQGHQAPAGARRAQAALQLEHAHRHRAASDPTRLYVGSQFLHRSHRPRRIWQRLSPDLTTNDPASCSARKSRAA